jgi:peptide/nickel transport system permease protein
MAHRAGQVSSAFIVLLAAVGVLAPWLTSDDPNRLGEAIMQPPSWTHPFGTDDLGHDVLAGVIWGIRVSLTVGFLSALAASLLGGLIGATAGFYGGAVDLAFMRVSEMFQVVPGFIVAAVIVALLGAGLTQVIIVIALLAWPQIARVIRGEVIRIRQLEFVDAVRCLGEREPVILVREIIPNALPPAAAVGTLIVGGAILLEVSLGFLGLSSPDIVSWGRMLNSGQHYLFSAWWISFFPGLAILLTVLAFNLLGDALGAALNPRTAAR